MRISDWSSDVCSSDPAARQQAAPSRDAGHDSSSSGSPSRRSRRIYVSAWSIIASTTEESTVKGWRARLSGCSRGKRERMACKDRERKSVVEGKSEKVRVDLDVCGYIKKKKKKNKYKSNK